MGRISKSHRRITMKKLTGVCFLVAMSLMLTACGGPSHMIKKETYPTAASIKPAPGKSALMISRTTGFGGAVEFSTYLDRQMIGVTKGMSYFAKNDIEPGKKYVISWGENGEAVEVDFQTGTTYYLQHNVAMGIWKARVVMEALNAKRLDSGDLKGCVFYEYDLKQPGPDLTEAEFKDVIQGALKLVVKPNGEAELVSPAK
jgi:hypothetical protein